MGTGVVHVVAVVLELERFAHPRLQRLVGSAAARQVRERDPGAHSEAGKQADQPRDLVESQEGLAVEVGSW